jgi:hypothetical protein
MRLHSFGMPLPSLHGTCAEPFLHGEIARTMRHHFQLPLAAMKNARSAVLTDDFLDERRLRIRIRLAIVAVLAGKVSLQPLIARGNRRVGTQRVTKLQMLNPRLAAEDDKVEVMSPSAQGLTHQPAPVWQGGVKLGGGLVAARAQGVHQGIGLTHRLHSTKDVDDRLRGETWNRLAADMFDGDETTRQEIQKAIPLFDELRRPSRVVRDDANLFDDGAR